MADAQVAPAVRDPSLDPAADDSIAATQYDDSRHLSSSPFTSHAVTAAAQTFNNSRNVSPMIDVGDVAPDLPSHPTSSSTSVKGEDSSAAPYGTRSRIRPGPRPNYSDELDSNFEVASRKVESAIARHATPIDSPSTLHNTTEMPSTSTTSVEKPRGFTAANRARPQTNGASPAHQHGSATPPAEAAQSRQKRKFASKAGADPSSTIDLDGHPIPGTSQFPSTAKASDHPAKRRKTAETVVNGAHAVATVPAPVRKTSSLGGKAAARESCVVSFEKSGAMLKNGKLHADDGTVYGVDDFVYLICEPPGDPYYLCRIMEFRKEDPKDPKAPIAYILVNWFYRPKDIARLSVDSRMLYASMQSDEAPLTSLRDLDEYKRQRDSFWFSELYDRYIHRPYNMVPAKAVINVPKNVKAAIDERWQYLVVEPSRMKELTSAVKLCKRCDGYCAPNDSVDCGVCRNTYHMTCVSPPLAKKPSRGFAWSCGPCSKAQEKKLEARHTSVVAQDSIDIDDETHEEEKTSGTISPEEQIGPSEKAPTPPMTHNQSEVARAQMWPWRYLGIHCNVEDVLQYDDRAIYPRASSRLGARHQALVEPWFGRAVELVPPPDYKKKYMKGSTSKKDAKLSKDTLAAIEADRAERAKRPKWIQDEPPGYTARGEDFDASDERCTAQRLFVVSPDGPPKNTSITTVDTSRELSDEARCEEFMRRAKELAVQRGYTRPIIAEPEEGLAKRDPSEAKISVPTNYLDRALATLYKHRFDVDEAFKELRTIKTGQDFGDPILKQEELKKFEDGVKKYGSELRFVKRHVKTKTYGEIVRFYYIWKKTERGIEIWGKSDLRRGSKKRTETSWVELADDEDDSAFDNVKSTQRKRKFECKFCLSRSSRQWRRAPTVAPGAVILVDPKASAKDKNNQLIVALCQRCAYPWRRYAIRWSEPEEFAKSLSLPGGRQWKRLQDEMMLRELVLANEAAHIPTTGIAATAAASIGITLTVPIPEPAVAQKKKAVPERDSTPTATSTETNRKKVATAALPRPPTPPIVPNQPIMRTLPCAVCDGDATLEPIISCSSCKLTVHRQCYAVPAQAKAAKWTCDTCANDKNSMYSLDYRCVLCTTHERTIELVEGLKDTHKKMHQRDKDKRALEKALAEEMVSKYKRDQISKGRPPLPREALKHTASNNWIHIVCAVWTPEIKFGRAADLDEAEGVGAVMGNSSRLDAVCRICGLPDHGTTVGCNGDKCTASAHVSCAQVAKGYRLGFDIKPVKGSKKDSPATLAFGGENGLMTAVMYCDKHPTAETSILHGMQETNEAGDSALTAFVRTYKQADTTLTGTARKANALTQSSRAVTAANQMAVLSAAGRRSSKLQDPKARRNSATSLIDEADGQLGSMRIEDYEDAECSTCGSDVSFRWWPASDQNDEADFQPDTAMVNGDSADLARHGKLECHQCHVLKSDINGDLETLPPTSDDESEEEVAVPDGNYFSLTMAPPTPTPAPSGTVPAQQPPQQPWGPGWNGQQGHHGQMVPPASAGPIIDHANPDIEKWTRELWASTIILNIPNGRPITYGGGEFGSLNDPPAVPWGSLVRKAKEKANFDNAKQVIRTEEGIAVEDEASMVSGLASIIKAGAREVRWRVEDRNPDRNPFGNPPQFWHGQQLAPPPMQPQPGLAPPPPGNMLLNRPTSFGSSWLSQQGHPLPPPFSPRSPLNQPQLNRTPLQNYVPPHAVPPQRAGSMTSDVRSGSRGSSIHQSPLLSTQIASPNPQPMSHPTPQEAHNHNVASEMREEAPQAQTQPASAAAPGSMSTNANRSENVSSSAQLKSPIVKSETARSTTPIGITTQQVGQAGGASSSPNLKNLMHL